MDSVRRISKLVSSALHSFYRKGALVEHQFDDGDAMRSYESWSDSEAVLTTTNSIQDDVRILEFIEQFNEKEYTLGNRTVRIKGLKITHPHTFPRHDLPPPHPSMPDNEILQYRWPNGKMNREGGDYTGNLWIDIGDDDMEISPIQGAEAFLGRTFRQEEWINVLAYPMMVGSNKCNVAIMRSYLDDPEWSEQASYILNDLLKVELDIPDGYFVIHGKMKTIHVIDKLQMNMIYTIKVASQQDFGGKRLIPVGQRTSEVRSLRTDLGLAYHQVLLTMDPNAETSRSDSDETSATPRGSKVNREIFRFYNSILSIMIDSEFDAPINVFDLVRAYGILMMGFSTQQAMDDFVDTMRKLSNNDMDIMRAVLVSRSRSIVRSDDEIVQMFRRSMVPANISVDDSGTIMAMLRERLRRKFLPHCESLVNPSTFPSGTYATQETYEAKLRFLSMMVVELMLTVLERADVTDRKDFSYKRWEAPGYLLRDYIRSLLHSQSKIEIMTKGINHLLTFMNNNQWPSRYQPRGAYNQGKTDHKDGIVDDVSKFNVASMIDSIRTVKISARSSVNTAAIRRVHGSQWGFQCPANTPENANIGLNNNLAEVALISEELTRKEYASIVSLVDGLEDGPYLLLVDGNPIRYVSEQAYEELRNARRTGAISRSVGIARHYMWLQMLGTDGVPVIVLRTSHGRPIVPLFVLDQNPTKLDDILSISDEPDMENLMNDGFVEFVDTYELVYNVVVAEWLHIANREYEDTGSLPYTHAMIMPGHTLSTVTNMLRFQENGPAARATYGTVHMKQSIGHPFKFPEERFEHEINYLFNPEPPLITTDSARRVARMNNMYGGRFASQKGLRIGRNLRFAIMPFNGNVDDGVHFSEELVQSGFMAGVHFNIFNSDHSITPQNRYNWQLGDDMQPIIDIETGQGLIDPDFSDSVVLPYGDPYIIEVNRLPNPINLSIFREPKVAGVVVYQIEPGKLHIRHGSYRQLHLTYVDNITGERYEKTLIPGEEPMNIPGRTIVERRYGERVYRMALAYLREDMRSQYESKFVDPQPMFTITREGTSYRWYGPAIVRIPLTRSGDSFVTMGRIATIRPKRAIARGDIAVKVLEREDGRIIDVKKERFDITHGFIEDIIYGPVPKIKGGMPIGPKPGNKYAALYAQKSICAKIIPTEQMPKARWTNAITGEVEEMTFHVIFNPLAFPSRMTIGMEYELYIAGTLDYLFSLREGDRTLKEIYENDRAIFDDVMQMRFGVDDASSLIDELSDATVYIYENEEKKDKARNLRNRLGIPRDGLYDLYLRDENTNEWTRRIENPIQCGTAYYVALRHLVDNKRRARGYVGKRDPLTLQPVKGRRRNGGAVAGGMELDALKAHGARAMHLERISRVSDHKVLLKCPYCPGLVSYNQVSGQYVCVECESIVPPGEVIDHDTVWSWELFKRYCLALNIQIKENFE